jgi:Domain of unknown function (DUF397)
MENWRVSRYSGTNGNCVEVADESGMVQVRDTKNREAGSVAFTADAWAKFTASLQ